jgi:hypothetical protein
MYATVTYIVVVYLLLQSLMVTDHDVSTDAELIWLVVFDDGDECDLNLAELLPILLPETHLHPTKSNPNPSSYFSFAARA